MNTLYLKLILTPTLIALASLAGRRWGSGVSGWLVGLPLTSGPIAFFLALEHGTQFAAATALGTLAGTIAQALTGLVYARLAARTKWAVALVISIGAFVVMTAILQPLNTTIIPLFLLVCATLVIGLMLMPRQASTSPTSARMVPRWDLPFRMILTTTFVILLTGAASLLGPHLTGMLTPFPMYAMTLAIFAHSQEGPTAAVNVWRGLLFGLFAFACFFLTLTTLLTPIGIAGAFFAAALVALLVQGASLWVFRRLHA